MLSFLHSISSYLSSSHCSPVLITECPASEGDKGLASMSLGLQFAGLWAHHRSVASEVAKDKARAVFTLSSTMAWTSKEVCRHPSPIHNYLFISCFVSTVVARVNAMNTKAKEESPV